MGTGEWGFEIWFSDVGNGGIGVCGYLYGHVKQTFGCRRPLIARDGLYERKVMAELLDGGGGIKR